MLYEYLFRYITNAQSGENMRIFKSRLQAGDNAVDNGVKLNTYDNEARHSRSR